MRFFSLRALFLLGFIVAMPVLALPSVAKRIDQLLYGAAPTDFGRAPVPPPTIEEPVAPVAPSQTVKSSIAPARFDEVSPVNHNLVQPAQAITSAQPASGGTHYETANPPSLPASPPFAVTEPPSSSPEPQIDERTIARLQQLRDRLEQLGAEYVLVDVQDSGRFRFHCRMLVDPRTRYTRAFDATSFDAAAAGEQVLKDVEKWRAAATSIPANSTP
jgi:hypothetical protein